MKQKLFSLLFLLVLSSVSGCLNETPAVLIEDISDDFVFVQGGAFVNTTSNLFATDLIVQDFYIGKYEVTQKEWVEVMGSNPSEFQDDQKPVENVSWYDVILYCNMRSVLEGLEPFYQIDQDHEDPNNFSIDDEVKWTVNIDEKANGYRLPLEFEWEYAAGGGQKSKSYVFSGSDDPDEVAWYFRNSGDEYLTGFWHWPALEANNGQTRPVGQKSENELGLYDMSGNVREWVWNWYGDDLNPENGAARVIRGGGWVGDEEVCKTYFRESMEPHYRFADLGFRLVRGH